MEHMAGLELGLALNLRELRWTRYNRYKMVRDEVCTQHKWHVTLLCVSRSLHVIIEEHCPKEVRRRVHCVSAEACAVAHTKVNTTGVIERDVVLRVH